MFKKIKDKRGVALEMAIVMLITMFSLSTILYIVAYREYFRDRTTNTTITVPALIEGYGETFFYKCKNNKFNEIDDGFKPDGYDASYYNDTENSSYVYILTAKRTVLENEIEVLRDIKILEVHIDYSDEDNMKITKWYYLNETNDESYLDDIDSEYEEESVWD